MTSALSSQAYPETPTGPTTAPEGYHTPGTISPTSTSPFPGEKVESYRGNFIELILREVVKGLTGVFFPGAGAAFDQLVNWVQNILPGWIKEPIIALVNLLVDVLDLIPVIGPPVGDALEYFASIFGFMRDKTEEAQGTGTAAQVSADTANVGVARLEGQLAAGNVPGGTLFDDTFARSGPDLGPDYTQVNTGPAGGTLSTDGSNAQVLPSGAGQTYCYGQIVTLLTTDNQAISVVQESPFQNILSSGEWEIALRCNADRSDRIVAKVSVNSCAIGKVVGNTYTQLASVSQGNTTGDRWTLKVGTDPLAGGDIREIQLFYNTSSTPLLSAIDNTATLSNYGPMHLGAMIGQFTALYYIPPFFTQVGTPPKMQSVTAYDRLPNS